jgi:hypothetical protein
VSWRLAEPAGRAFILGDLPTGSSSSIVTLPHLPTRHYLQAWKGLRELGEAPKPNVVRLLYAVVLDMPMENGWDTLAVYRDYTCHYANLPSAQ